MWSSCDIHHPFHIIQPYAVLQCYSPAHLKHTLMIKLLSFKQAVFELITVAGVYVLPNVRAAVVKMG